MPETIQEAALDVRLVPSCMSLTMLYDELKMFRDREEGWPTSVVMTWDQAVDYRCLIDTSHWGSGVRAPTLRELSFEGAPVVIEDV